jgi:hypothetical protein
MGRRKTEGPAEGASPKRDASGWTTPTQFRFTPDELARIDRLRERLGLRSRIDALRVALNRACQAEGIDATAPLSTQSAVGQGEAQTAPAADTAATSGQKGKGRKGKGVG